MNKFWLFVYYFLVSFYVLLSDDEELEVERAHMVDILLELNIKDCTKVNLKQ